MVFADADSPVYLQCAFDMAADMLASQAMVEKAFNTGKGVAGAISRLHVLLVGRFFRTGYHNNLVAVVAAGAGRGSRQARGGCEGR